MSTSMIDDCIHIDNVLLVQRYSDLESNAHAALCNAAQEPGLLSTLAMMRRNKKDFLDGFYRDPHIYDIMAVLSKHMADGNLASNEKDDDLCCFLGGFPFEAETFAKLMPKIFFITLNMNKNNVNFPKWGIHSRTQFVVPVILRGRYYYIIIGKENFPVYRVHHPIEFFFSADGKTLLMTLIGRCNENNSTIEMLCTNAGREILYFLPGFKIADGWPNHQWDGLTIEQIRKRIKPFHLLVEGQENISLQSDSSYIHLIRLEDKENVVDIPFPEQLID